MILLENGTIIQVDADIEEGRGRLTLNGTLLNMTLDDVRRELERTVEHRADWDYQVRLAFLDSTAPTEFEDLCGALLESQRDMDGSPPGATCFDGGFAVLDLWSSLGTHTREWICNGESIPASTDSLYSAMSRVLSRARVELEQDKEME